MAETQETRTRRMAQPSSGAAEIPPMSGIIGYKLRRAQLVVFQDFLKTFSKLKLRPVEFSVLSLIAENPGRKQTEIADALGVKRANFVALMDSLEKRGFAERRKSDSDRRSHSLHLTPQGQKFVRRMVQVWREHEDRFIERLGGASERDRLIAMLDRIIADTDDPSAETQPADASPSLARRSAGIG